MAPDDFFNGLLGRPTARKVNTMKLELNCKGVRMTGILREHVERRLGYALSRFGERVRRVRIQLTDINGPRGGEDVQCRILATLAPTGEVVIRETRDDPFSAVARACDRISHKLARHVERRRSFRKRK